VTPTANRQHPTLAAASGVVNGACLGIDHGEIVEARLTEPGGDRVAATAVVATLVDGHR
jgi:hypothetical protein